VPDVKRVAIDWQRRGMVFQTDADGKKPVLIDGGSTGEGPSPVEALLHALAACTASDVVSILEKKRVPVQDLRVEVTGTRRDEYPRRYIAIKLTFDVRAAGATEQGVRQAIDLSLEKYCSVSHSLNPDIPLTYELVLQA
jgi:putative redox protein